MVQETTLQQPVTNAKPISDFLQLSMHGEVTAANAHSIYHKLRIQMNNATCIKVSLAGIEKIDLAGFNALIQVYITAKRLRKELTFEDCYDKRLVHLVTLTRFHHVFHTE